jgi:hypothetical protein
VGEISGCDPAERDIGNAWATIATVPSVEFKPRDEALAGKGNHSLSRTPQLGLRAFMNWVSMTVSQRFYAGVEWPRR